MTTISSARPQSPAARNHVQSLPVQQSPSATPTSSVRASFDLPILNRSSSPAPPSASQRRNRAALRDYYNLKSKPPSQNVSSGASIASTTSNDTTTSNATFIGAPSSSDPLGIPPQLDEPDFDADSYIQNLLKTSDLRTVLRAEGTLISEIKNLDGERKALVYDNYSRLITATQTIGNMRRIMNEDGGGSLRKLGDLNPAVEAVARMAEQLARTSVDRDNAEQTVVVAKQTQAEDEKNKKATVRWVLGASKRLKTMLESGQREEAVAEWKGLEQLLDKWQGVRGVDQVKKACEDAMKI